MSQSISLPAGHQTISSVRSCIRKGLDLSDLGPVSVDVSATPDLDRRVVIALIDEVIFERRFASLDVVSASTVVAEHVRLVAKALRITDVVSANGVLCARMTAPEVATPGAQA